LHDLLGTVKIESPTHGSHEKSPENGLRDVATIKDTVQAKGDQRAADRLVNGRLEEPDQLGSRRLIAAANPADQVSKVIHLSHVQQLLEGSVSIRQGCVRDSEFSYSQSRPLPFRKSAISWRWQ